PPAAQPLSSVHKKHEPPPPPTPAGRPAEKGVRVEFDPVALELASSRLPILSEVEDRLLAAHSPDEVDRALTWVDERVNDALAVGKASSSLQRVTIVSLRKLCGAAAAYRTRWQQLPDELRHPGPLRRVHGFLIDA